MRNDPQSLMTHQRVWNVLVADPTVPDSDAVYWKDCQPTRPSRRARRSDEATRLWALSERLCGIAWA